MPDDLPPGEAPPPASEPDGGARPVTGGDEDQPSEPVEAPPPELPRYPQSPGGGGPDVAPPGGAPGAPPYPLSGPPRYRPPAEPGAPPDERPLPPSGPPWYPGQIPDGWSDAGSGSYSPPPPGYGHPYGAPPGGAPWDLPYRAASPFATFGRRLGGWLLDWVITAVVEAVVLLPLHDITRTRTINPNGTSSAGVHITTQGYLLSVLIVIIYATVFIGSRRGQTIGMMAVRARAVDAVTGAPIGHARALARAVFEYLALFVFILPWFVDMLFPLWDRRRQTLHDKVTNTVVVTV